MEHNLGMNNRDSAEATQARLSRIKRVTDEIDSPRRNRSLANLLDEIRYVASGGVFFDYGTQRWIDDCRQSGTIEDGVDLSKLTGRAMSDLDDRSLYR